MLPVIANPLPNVNAIDNDHSSLSLDEAEEDDDDDDGWIHIAPQTNTFHKRINDLATADDVDPPCS